MKITTAAHQTCKSKRRRRPATLIMMATMCEIEISLFSRSSGLFVTRDQVPGFILFYVFIEEPGFFLRNSGAEILAEGQFQANLGKSGQFTGDPLVSNETHDGEERRIDQIKRRPVLRDENSGVKKPGGNNHLDSGDNPGKDYL